MQSQAVQLQLPPATRPDLVGVRQVTISYRGAQTTPQEVSPTATTMTLTGNVPGMQPFVPGDELRLRIQDTSPVVNGQTASSLSAELVVTVQDTTPPPQPAVPTDLGFVDDQWHIGLTPADPAKVTYRKLFATVNGVNQGPVTVNPGDTEAFLTEAMFNQPFVSGQPLSVFVQDDDGDGNLAASDPLNSTVPALAPPMPDAPILVGFVEEA